VISWWSLRKALSDVVRTSGIADVVMSVCSHEKLAKYFKALAHPTRVLIIALMIDGRYYTKEDLLELLTRIDEGLTPASVERHVRTLESYGVIKQYSLVRRGGRGRKAVAYVMREDAREFMESLLTYLLTTKHLRMVKYVIRSALSNIFRDVVTRAKLATYLSLPLSNECVDEIRCRINYVVTKLAKYVVATPTKYGLCTCEEAVKYLKALTKSPQIRSVGRDKVLKILYASLITSESPTDCVDLSRASELSTREIIKELIASCYLGRRDTCCSLLIDLAKSLMTYVSYVTSVSRD